MLRARAVRAILFDLAGLRIEAADDETEAERLAGEGENLERAIRRAGLVAALDAGAIVVLFALRDRHSSFLPVGASEETVLTLGVLAIAVHMGFRLAQWMLYRSVRRALEELPD